MNRSKTMKRFWRAWFNATVAVALALAPTLSMQAQTFTGSIGGKVTDQQGSAVGGATITLTAAATQQKRVTTTSEQGEFNFVSLAPGKCRLDVSATGFSTQQLNAELSVSQQLRVDAQMKVGAVSEAVNITAGEGGVAVETENSQLSNVVSQRQISTLPLITRNPYDLVALSTGVTDGPDRGS